MLCAADADVVPVATNPAKLDTLTLSAADVTPVPPDTVDSKVTFVQAILGKEIPCMVVIKTELGGSVIEVDEIAAEV